MTNSLKTEMKPNCKGHKFVSVLCFTHQKQPFTEIFVEPNPTDSESSFREVSGGEALREIFPELPKSGPSANYGDTRGGWPSPPRNGPEADNLGHESGQFSPARPAIFASFLHRVCRGFSDFDGCGIGCIF